MFYTHQHTIRQSISCEGTGLHSGEAVKMTLLPAPAGQGVLFQRTDITGKQADIPAHYDLVSDTMLGTTLTNADNISVSTVEHLMAALAGLGIDNITIQLNAPEVPIMDGSSEPFIFLLECAGLRKQAVRRRYLRVLEPVRAEQGDSWVELRPCEGFAMNTHIDFSHSLIASQDMQLDFKQVTFKGSLSRARTFGFEEDVSKLRSMGLARGGSLDNAIVLGKDRIINEDGLRFQDEFVRHKMLDCIGDLYLAGGQLLAEVKGNRTGHGINNQVLHSLFAQAGAWEWSEIREPASAEAGSTYLPADKKPAPAELTLA